MSKQGSSLIETMVAMVLLLIICLSSAYFFAIPPFRKEALRFAALERAHGMMDLMFASQKALVISSAPYSFWESFYEVVDCPTNGGNPTLAQSDGSLLPLMISTNMPPVWYTLKVAVPTTTVPSDPTHREVQIKLYVDRMDTNSIFATFKLLLPPLPSI